MCRRERLLWMVWGAGLVAAVVLAMTLVPAAKHLHSVRPDHDAAALTRRAASIDRS